jgi:hypothetical protein
MKRRYPGDYEAGSGTFTKNRFVSADKYKRVDQQTGGTEENDDVFNLSDMDMEDVAVEDVDLILSSSDEDDDDTNRDYYYNSQAGAVTTTASGEADEDDAFDMWLRALDAAVPENGDEDYYDELRNLYDDHRRSDDMTLPSQQGQQEAKNKNGDEEAEEEEDECECRRENLPPLPEENQTDYPQENQQYFAGKNYVRTDKYSLKGMLSGIVEGQLMEDTEEWLPTIMSAFRSST